MPTTHSMSHADAAWFHMDRPTNHMVINSVLTFDEPVDPERLTALIRGRIVEPFPRFRQRVVGSTLSGMQWEDDPRFDLDLHVHRLALPAPADDDALRAQVADLMSAELDHDKPLWHAYLIEGYGSGSALVMRMHHCIADGIALAQVMLLMTDQPDGDEPPLAPPRRGRRFPGAGLVGAAGTLLHESVETVLHPGHLLDLGREARDDVSALLTLTFGVNDPHTALKGDHGIAQRVAWTPPLPLPDVKDIAHATQTTVNDVLVTALCGGLARYLEAHGDDVDELHAMVPFNLRPPGEPLPADLGNRFGLIILGLPMTADGPLDRLAEVHRRMLEIKASRQPAMSYAILTGMGLSPTAVEKLVLDIFSAKSTAVVTNVPGPRSPIHLAGVPIRDVLVWAPCAGSVGMSVSIFSYCDTVTVGFMTHASLVDDPETLAADLVAELEALRAATAAQASS